ncbi:hypothetical protein F5Y18DRAFT_428812 [Xylariaceae sp. FL1019]|nr:hypothetical protein F5Y18DRAFT_428812 [Xylariaceae sp. FL1019]
MERSDRLVQAYKSRDIFAHSDPEPSASSDKDHCAMIARTPCALQDFQTHLVSLDYVHLSTAIDNNLARLPRFIIMHVHIPTSMAVRLASIAGVSFMHIPELALQSTSTVNPPTQTTIGHQLTKRVDCDDAVNGEPQYDCDGRPRQVNEDGTCGTSDDWDNTAVFCPRQNAPGDFGDLQSKGQVLGLEEGHETTMTTGFSIGGDESLEDAVALGASFQFSLSETTSQIIGQTGVANENYRSRWVHWPVLTETCGDVISTRYVAGTSGGGGLPFPPYCTGNAATGINFCSTGQIVNDLGHALVLWDVGMLMLYDLSLSI